MVAGENQPGGNKPGLLEGERERERERERVTDPEWACYFIFNKLYNSIYSNYANKTQDPI